jgi:hypothetical protein
MPRYLYTGPEGQRGLVPSWGFDDGVLAPEHLTALIDRGHVRDLRANPTAAAPGPQPEPTPTAGPRTVARPAAAKSRTGSQRPGAHS